MHYDPVKNSVNKFFKKSATLRILFYRLLDLLLLRTWHVHHEVRNWVKTVPDSSPVHILDAGAGFGQYSYFLSTINPQWNILAVDVKDDLISECNKFFYKLGRDHVLFKTADLTKFRQDNAFDLIISVDVMEHIVDDTLVFGNFYKSLKAGGMLLVSTPSDKNPGDHHPSRTPFVEEHVRSGYNIFEIKNKLKSCGFSKVDARYSYGIAGKISWRLSMKYPMLLLGFGKIFFIVLPFYYIIAYPVSYVLNIFDVLVQWKSGTGLIVKAWK